MRTLVIEEILRFFDGDGPNCARHSNALNSVLGEELAVLLLTLYLREAGYEQVVRLPDPCTQGTKKGTRLDLWLSAMEAGEPLLFQVEIKNWCAHSLGGRALSRDADATLLAQRAIENWLRYWDVAQSGLREKALRKVLEPMKRPTRHAEVPVRPVACLWDVLHPDPEGGMHPWFEVPVQGSFTGLHFFSMSTYLRGLAARGVKTLQADMPLLDERLGWIERMFQGPQ